MDFSCTGPTEDPISAMPHEASFCIAAFLSRADVGRFLSVNKAARALAPEDALWEAVWPWRSRLGRPLQTAGSWQGAHRLVATIKRRTAVLERIPLPPVDGLLNWGGSEGARGERSGGAAVTCSAHSPSFLALGCSDGCVRVVDLHGGATSTFALASGSVRNLQLVARRPATDAPAGAPALLELYAGSWNGTVHAIDLRTGAVRLAVSSLGGPVLALCVVGEAIAASAGDGRIGVFGVVGDSHRDGGQHQQQQL